MTKKQFKIGTRVYHAKDPNSIGIIAGPVFRSEKDGGDRQLILWDLSGIYTSHDPVFLFEEGTPYEQVPDVIQSGDVIFLKKTGFWGKRIERNDFNN